MRYKIEPSIFESSKLIVETNVGADDLNTVVQVQARTESNPGVFTDDVQDQGVFTIPSNTELISCSLKLKFWSITIE